MFVISFFLIKKIKKIGKIFFINFFNKFNKNIIIKNISLKIKPTIIGIYYFNFKNKDYIFEICYYKNIINKFNNFYIFKSNLIFFIKNFFFNLNFFELDVPLIEKTSNNGSKQFLIINKNKKKEFFSLSQSPQCVKQYYMFNNVKKYFKIINCFRDEDERSNRIKEFLQLDIEISFSNFLILKNVINILFKFLIFYYLKKKIYFLTVKYKYIKKFFFEKKNFKTPYLYKKKLIKNRFLYIFKSIKFNIKIKKIFLKIKKYIIIILKKKIIFKICFYLDFFLKFYNLLNLKLIFIWYVNFYYFKKTNIKHHHFSSYKNKFNNIYTSKSLSYDLNLNGIEIGGGSIRNIYYQLQKKNLFLLKEKKSKFLNFYKKSIPQHCGIAIGIERFLSIICNINIKKSITYYKYKKIITSSKIN
ncbi:aspartyl-tRNA synthetase [Candidatus Carsonella ruddii HT isolate Thao2000]|uniref:Aspartyl-tRNA synthetase n=1 Tax=Candidatus Carsonella ruddii HT isolate Thao2000 TaxID=1202539 RepID=J3VQA2_CARRU|nr:amino acid--tRNA ligase-related protein [Candidatus Carsonella ruddii]AFP84121.1 aspartyl-tRNA synthetase [Candidatus Carsonella ruddii HT isolate Thao2000]